MKLFMCEDFSNIYTRLTKVHTQVLFLFTYTCVGYLWAVFGHSVVCLVGRPEI